MRLHRILTAVALTALVGAPLVVATPALAGGVWVTPAYSVHVPTFGQLPGVAQAPIFGGPRAVEQAKIATVNPQIAANNEDTIDAAPTFVAPGVDRNAAGQIERTP